MSLNRIVYQARILVFILICLCLLLPGSPRSLSAQTPTPPDVVYIEGNNIIRIGSTVGTPASQPITLPEVAAKIGRADVLADQGGGVWFLQANIVVEATGQLIAAKTSGTTELRLRSQLGENVFILANQGGYLLFDNVKVTSWDPGANSGQGGVDQDISNYRAYVLAEEGSRIDILNNSEFAYLGDQLGGTRSSGVSWVKRLNPADPTTGGTGIIENSKFHHNYQGLFISGGYNLKIRNNEIYSNQFHGAYLRDGTQAAEVSGNTIHNNGGNGIYFNQLSTGNTIRDNPAIHTNVGNGIVLERGSNVNTVTNNIVYQNVDGILLDESDSNLVQGNQTRDNQNGIHVKGTLIDPAAENQLIGNIIEGSKSTSGGGVYLDTHADSNKVRNNTITGSLGYGIYVKLSGGNELAGNVISAGNRGIGISGAAESIGQIPLLQPAGSHNVIISNTVTTNSDSGIRIEGGVKNGIGADPLTGAPLANNQINANVGGGVVIKSTTAGYPSTDNQVVGNVIRGNGKSGVEVHDSGTDRNRISRNIITGSGGSGIKVDGGAQQNIQPPVVNDILADGTVVGTAAVNATIEVYSDPGGEGETRLGDAISDANGNWTFPLPTGQDTKRVTALVIDASGNTSAFSAASGSSVEFFTSVTANPTTINVTGEGSVVTLKSIQERLGAQNTGGILLEEQSSKVWLLKANLKLEKGVTLNINPDTVATLRLRSQTGVSGTLDYNNFVYIRTGNGAINIDGVEIVGWNPVLNAPDDNATDGRAFIVAKFGAELNINNSTISYLGMGIGKTDERGVTWDSATSVEAAGSVSTQVAGSVTNSKFHHNYDGVQIVQAGDMTFTTNEFYDNLRYGFYVRDGSRDITLSGSAAYNNGLHGVVIERGCTNVVLRTNKVYNNLNRGILITQGSAGGSVAPAPSNGNLVESNEVYGNRTYGIHIEGSNNNEVRNNILTSNEIGVNLSNSSTANNIHDNSAAAHLKHGFQVDQTANTNTLKNNAATQNTGVGIYLLASSNLLENNQATGNREQGIYLNPKDGPALQDNQLISNTVSGNTKSGIEVNGSNNTLIQRNRIEGNTVHGIYLTKGAVATKVLENIITANTENGIRVSELGSYQNFWSANSIFNNGIKGIVIAENANKNMPRPKITKIGDGVVAGSVTSPLARIEIFTDDNTQGRYFMARTTADAEGKFSIIICGAFQGGGAVATATDSEGNTSEFSDTFLVPSNPGAGCLLYLPMVRR